MRLAVLALVVCVAGSARADDRDEARREFAAGEAADKQQDWQTAIEHYLRANELVPHPFAVYNIASDYVRLGQLREAAIWYQRYEAVVTDPRDRDKAAKVLADLEARPGKVAIRSEPPGARVAIDGAPVGVTPYAGVARGGTHHVAVDRDGLHAERDFAIEYGEPADLAFELLGSGTLMVFAFPAGAVISVDGTAAGVAPATLAVTPGPHIVHVEAFGYVPYDTQTVVGPGQHVEVKAVLTRALGTLGTGPKLDLAYVIGAAGGADLGGSGPLVLAVFGARISRYEGVVRAGRASGAVEVDVLIRWAFADAKLSPFLGIGYSYVNNGFGYQASGGLRWDVARGEHVGLAVLADIGLRYYSGTDAMANAVSGVAWPLELSAEIVYR